MPTSFYNDSSDNLSLASQLSPGYPSNARAGANQGAQDSPDAPYFNDGRRPSAASILTASSTGSKTSLTRGGFRKLQGFFGEEFPGRDSSESSLPTSLMGKDRQRSYSHSRPTQRDRNYSNATDHTRDASPSSSRPRTPVPDPEVVPFLFQDTNVSQLCAALVHSFWIPTDPPRPLHLPLSALETLCELAPCRAKNATLTLHL